MGRPSYLDAMCRIDLVNEYLPTETDHFYKKEWSAFVIEVDRMTGGGPVARQLFFDARKKYLADKT